MNKNKVVVGLGLVCLLLSAALMLGRQRIRPDRLAPGQTLWRLSYQIVTSPLSRGQRLEIALPYETEKIKILGKALYHPDFVADTIRTKEMGQRELHCISRKNSARAVISCQIDLLTTPRRKRKRKAVTSLSADKRENCLILEASLRILAKQYLKKLKKEAIERPQIPHLIFDHCYNKLRDSSSDLEDEAQKVLASGNATPQGRTSTFIAL